MVPTLVKSASADSEKKHVFFLNISDVQYSIISDGLSRFIIVYNSFYNVYIVFKLIIHN